MTNHSLLKCPSFIEGIYNAIFHLHACIYVALSPFLLFNLAPALTPPKLSIISHLLSFFPPTEAPSFIHSRTPFFSLRQKTQVSLKRTSPGRVCCHGDSVNGLEEDCGKQNHSTGLIYPIRGTDGAGRGR